MKRNFTLLLLLAIAIVLSGQNVMFSESFNSGEGRFEVDDVQLPDGGSYVWSAGVYDNSGYMKASAYIGGEAKASEGWLVSPLIDLSSATVATLSFEHTAKFQNGDLDEEMTLWINTTGGGVFDVSEWRQIVIPTYPEAGDWNWSTSGDIDLTSYAGSGQPKVRIAFKYKSTNEFADSWQVRNVVIEGDGNVDDVFDPETADYTESRVTYWGDAVEGVHSFVIELSTAMDRNAIGAPIEEGAMLTYSVYSAKERSYCGNYVFSAEDNVIGTISFMYSMFQQFDNDGNSPIVSLFEDATLNVTYAGNKEFRFVYSAEDFLGNYFAGDFKSLTPAYDTDGNRINHLIEEEVATGDCYIDNTEYMIYTNESVLYVETEEGERVSIYNLHGVEIYSAIAGGDAMIVEGLKGSGLVLVKIGNSVTKVIL